LFTEATRCEVSDLLSNQKRLPLPEVPGYAERKYN
jgi:hypothetical protein